MQRLTQATPESAVTELRIVQPNIDQAHKWIASEREAHFQRLLDLTAAPSMRPLTYIVWPETASTFYLGEDAVHRRAIAAVMPRGAYLLTGVIRLDRDATGTVTHYYNSLIAMDDGAHIAAIYDKFHLVPFGEYIPFRNILPLPTLAALGVDFTAGSGVRTLHIDNLPSFSPLVCYEAIFPGEVADRNDRPRFLVNVTNDGWYARTAGPYQHFASARVRAIEEGLPLARSANTGISGVIDAYGRIKVKLDLSDMGFADVALPSAPPPTLFEIYGEKPFWFLFILLAAGAGIASERKKLSKN
jgi:apolipoprotein N-acyltransferase